MIGAVPDAVRPYLRNGSAPMRSSHADAPRV